MDTLTAICQLLIAGGIVNVWVLRPGKPSRWRPDGAANMREEFRRYGFPDWVRIAVGTIKLSLSLLLVVGIWVAPLAFIAASGMVVMMLGAVLSHVRIGDPIQKLLPAVSLLLLSAFVAYVNGPM